MNTIANQSNAPETQTGQTKTKCESGEQTAADHEAAIAAAQQRIAEEAQKTEIYTAQLDKELQLESLARERAKTEQAALEALEARVNTERQLATQLAMRIDQAKGAQEQAAQRTMYEEQLKLATAERKALEQQLRSVKEETPVQQQGSGMSAAHAVVTKPTYLGWYRYYFGALAVIIVVGYLMATSSWFSGDKPVVLPVQTVAEKAPANVENNLPASQPQAAVVADKTETVVEPQPSAETEIAKSVTQWADAWSQRDVVVYLSFYAADFKLPESMQRADWEAQRKSKLRKYHAIKVDLKDVKVDYSGGDTATVVFVQDFQADSYKEAGTRKELRLRKNQDRWLIVNERSM